MSDGQLSSCVDIVLLIVEAGTIWGDDTSSLCSISGSHLYPEAFGGVLRGGKEKQRGGIFKSIDYTHNQGNSPQPCGEHGVGETLMKELMR